MQRANLSNLPELDAYFARDRSTQQRWLKVWSGAILVGALLWLPPVLHSLDEETVSQPLQMLEDDPFKGLPLKSEPGSEWIRKVPSGLESGE